MTSKCLLVYSSTSQPRDTVGVDVCCAVWANIVDDGVRERVKPFRLLLYKAKVNGCVKLMFSRQPI